MKYIKKKGKERNEEGGAYRRWILKQYDIPDVSVGKMGF